jgi:sigma-B regulation protein RsbU (phosphoserine phosphatase)
MQVLVVNPPEPTAGGLPEGTSDVLRDIGWEVTPATDYASAVEVADSGCVDAVIVTAPGKDSAGRRHEGDFETLLRTIDAKRIAALVLADPPRRAGQVSSESDSLIETIDRRVSLSELRGRLSMMARFHTLLTRMDRELGAMQRLGRQLHEHFREVDQEMRLAGRLQRDFLPNLTEPIRNVQFAALYRPASWVSGDIFDVFPVDEEMTGFYLADVVGHGLAASLLTMFIKRAIVPIRGSGDGRTVIPPSETLAALNDALAGQALPNCQFITACYGLVDHRTLTLHYARGGHPYPFLIPADGEMRELKSPGGLVGISKGERFPTAHVQLAPGDKVLLYTDGVELLFPNDDGKRFDGGQTQARTSGWRRTIQSVAGVPVRDLLAGLESRLDVETESVNPRDDVTVVGLEVLER